jgi:hypothetical protein
MRSFSSGLIMIRMMVVIGAGLGLGLALSACKTTEPGVKSTRFAQYTTIEAGTADATKAAAGVLEDLGLQNIESSSTNVDGWAKGFMADKTQVNVTLERVSENVSEISVKVGSFGDPSLGEEIIAKVRKKLGIEPPRPATTGPAATQPNGG